MSDTVMKSQLTARMAELQETARLLHGRSQELHAELRELEENLISVNGAIQVLDELLLLTDIDSSS